MNNTDIQFAQDGLREKLSNSISVIPGLKELIKIEITGNPPYNSVTKMFIEPKNYREAINCYTKALKNNPDYKYIYYFRGSLRLESGKNSEAIADLSEYISHDPNSGRSYYKRGLAKINMGERESAFMDFKKAGELDLP